MLARQDINNYLLLLTYQILLTKLIAQALNNLNGFIIYNNSKISYLFSEVKFFLEIILSDFFSDSTVQ